jgi:Cof subfamily protein (haloacid dehalogenase superfamily)
VSKIRLLIADVDGTLLTPDKELTERAQRAVLALGPAGVAFAVVSARPPRGMRMLVGPLGLTTPIAAFDGGMLVHPDLSPIDEHDLPAAIIGQIVEAIDRHELDPWIYRGVDWFVRTAAPHVDREQRALRFAPILVPSFDGLREGIVKIVGVSDDLQAVLRCEADIRRRLGDHVSVTRSQPYFLDVTHPSANKGAVVTRLSKLLNVRTELIATIGDAPTDVSMFAQSGFSIAMGNASPEVQRAARQVTRSNTQDGFAEAVEKYILAEA